MTVKISINGPTQIEGPEVRYIWTADIWGEGKEVSFAAKSSDDDKNDGLRILFNRVEAHLKSLCQP